MANQAFVLDIGELPKDADDPRLGLVEKIHHALTETTDEVAVYVKGGRSEPDKGTHVVATFLLATVSGVDLLRLILFKQKVLFLTVDEMLRLQMTMDFLDTNRLRVMEAKPWM